MTKSFNELIVGIESQFDRTNLSSPELASLDCTGVFDDSRACTKHSVFVAVRGVMTDGHLFIEQAIQNGARVIVCERAPKVFSQDVVIVVVADSRLVLGVMAQNWFGRPATDMRLVGVTGTNGKTTVTHLVYELLCLLGVNAGLIGTTGNKYAGKVFDTPYTTPEPLMLAEVLSDMRDAGVEVCVMEVSSHALSLHRVAGLTFATAAFTSFSQDHMDFHTSMDEYFAIKCSLADLLIPEGTFYVHKAISAKVQTQVDCDVASYGMAEDNEQIDVKVSLTDVQEVNSATVSFGTFKGQVRSQMAGFFNLENTTVACALVHELGFDIATLCTLSPQLQGPPGRMQIVSPIGGTVVIVDYAHTPDALERALNAIRTTMASNQQLYCVFGCGGDRDSSKRPLMGRIAQAAADVVIVTSDNPRSESQESISQDILAGMPDTTGVVCLPDRREAIHWTLERASKQDVVLIAGKGHEEYQIIGADKRPFSDAEEVRKYFSLLQS